MKALRVFLVVFAIALPLQASQLDESSMWGLIEAGSGTGVWGDDDNLCFGDSDDYCIRYDSTATQWEFWSTDIDGGGTDGNLWTVSDGTQTVTFVGPLSVTHMHQPSLTTETPAGTTETIDFNNGNIQKLDLEDATGDVTLTLSNPQVGRYILIIQQDGGGGAHNVVWPGTVTWSNSTLPTISTGNDAVDVVECVYDGATYYCSIQQDFS